jgi:hypothetical protein
MNFVIRVEIYNEKFVGSLRSNILQLSEVRGYNEISSEQLRKYISDRVAFELAVAWEKGPQ